MSSLIKALNIFQADKPNQLQSMILLTSIIQIKIYLIDCQSKSNFEKKVYWFDSSRN